VGEWKSGLQQVLAQVDVFLPNEVELDGITGEQDPVAGIRALQNGRTLTVAKLGAHGALALKNGEPVHVPAPAVEPVDLTGAGDCFNAGFLYGHLAGMPLHWQLSSRDARLVARTRTAPAYKLYAMANTTPPKPALVHAPQGAAIEVEVYELPMSAFGSFVAEVPPPLAIGTLSLEDGSEVKGFVAEPRATNGAEDITALGGWRAYLARG